MTFKELGIIEPIIKALDVLGYERATPIQEASIPILLDGYDLLGCAQTGTGKTAAFSIPIIQHMYNAKQVSDDRRKHIKALIVTPTRELAIQIGESLKDYGKHTGLRGTVIFGGVKQGAQTRALDRGVDILVATPGRLLDLMNQGYISLRDIEYFVLDEADRMLDMGFIHDIRKLLAELPEDRQSLFFSATMAPEIISLSNKILGNPKTVTIKPEQTTAERVDQSLYFVTKGDKIKLLHHLLSDTYPGTAALVFSRTKHGANKIVKKLLQQDITAAAIHGNKSQAARQKALKSFKDGNIQVLVATDIAARGIDIDSLSLVINYDLPNIPESYVHRIGRTGRASASGSAISFCMSEERAYLKDIQKLIQKEITVIADHPFEADFTGVPIPSAKKSKSSRPNNRNGRNSRSGPRKNTSGGSENKSNSNKKRRFYGKAK